MITDQQRERLLDIIDNATLCCDPDCTCYQRYRLAQDILAGREDYEVIDGEF